MKSSTKKTKLKFKTIILAVLAVFILSCTIDLILSNNIIKVTNHTLESDKIDEPVRLVVVTDLHSKEFGKDNSRLISKIENQNPDLILTVGDLIERNKDADKNLEYIDTLIRNLSDIAPVYSCIGNHERDNEDRDNIEDVMKSAGATLLNLDSQYVNVNGNDILFGGISYYRSWDEESNAYLQEYETAGKDSFTLLLCHHPELYLWGIEQYSIDLMTSGHTHGGMVRLPFVGALHAPEQGEFPEYAGGFYKMEKGHLAVCRGLGSSPENLPRFHNLPEVMVIDLI